MRTEAAAGSAAGCCCGRPRPCRIAGGESYTAHPTFWAGGAEYVTGSGLRAAAPPFRPSSAPALRGAVLMPRKSDWTAREDAALHHAGVHLAVSTWGALDPENRRPLDGGTGQLGTALHTSNAKCSTQCIYLARRAYAHRARRRRPELDTATQHLVQARQTRYGTIHGRLTIYGFV
jgi:hypothetical protein